jgi:hypothetical protein
MPDDTVTLSHPIPAPSENVALGLAVDMFMLKLFGMGPAFTLQYMKDHDPPDITVTLVGDEQKILEPTWLNSEEFASEKDYGRGH